MTRSRISIDGRLQPPGSPAPQGPFLYQHIHTLDYAAPHLERHLELLDRFGRQLFGCTTGRRPEAFAEEIGRLLHAERYPEGSASVELHLHPDGRTVLLPGGISLYRGYDLRSIHPAALPIPSECYRPEIPTSARIEAGRWAAIEAQRAGARCAIEYDGHGTVRRADGAPLFAVRGKVVYTSPYPDEQSVERDLAAEAIRAAGFDLIEQPVGCDQLPLFDELLYFDCRGLTAISTCNGRIYMDIAAHRIVDRLRRILPGK